MFLPFAKSIFKIRLKLFKKTLRISTKFGEANLFGRLEMNGQNPKRPLELGGWPLHAAAVTFVPIFFLYSGFL